MAVEDQVTTAAAVLAQPDAGVDSGHAAAPSLRLPDGRKLVLRMAVGLAIGTALALTFLQLVQFRAVSRRLEHLNVILALLCGVVFLSAYAVRALRWRRFLAPDVVAIPRAIAIYLVAIFLNWLLPIQGGELAKSLILRRSNGIPVSRSLATVSMDKAMDLLPAVVLLAVVPFTQWRLGGPLWLLLLTASLVMVVGTLVVALVSWRRDRTLSWLSRLLAVTVPGRLHERVSPFLEGFVDSLIALVRKPRLLLIAAAYTAVAVSLDALFCFLAFRAVGASVPLPVVLFGYTLYNLAYILPTPPGHIGSNELVGLLIFSGVFGVSRTSVGAMFLFSHPWTAFLMTTTGLLALRGVGLNIRSTLQLGSDAEPEVTR
jgi:uncharacterized protein (TIRG00374 family)